MTGWQFLCAGLGVCFAYWFAVALDREDRMAPMYAFAMVLFITLVAIV